MKKVIRLTEGDLHRIVKESVNRVINEMEDFNYDCRDYRDLGTTIGFKGFSDVFKAYNDIKRILNYNIKDWDFLHLTDWGNFFNNLKYTAERFNFNNSSANEEDLIRCKEFKKDAYGIPYPDLSLASSTSFVEKAENVRKSLKYAYRIYGDFIDYLASKHKNGEMKQQDIDADWAKFDKTRQNFVKRNKEQADNASFKRRLKNMGFSTNVKNPLRRYDIVANPNDSKNKEYHNNLIGNFDI
jgi:hypothetical protein